jgi:diguanylate cyclase (GGDEF)-like protein
MSNPDAALKTTQLRALLTLSRELLQTNDIGVCLGLVGKALAETTRMRSALLVVPDDGRHDTVVFDHRGTPRQADSSHPSYPPAAALLHEAGARPTAHVTDPAQADAAARNLVAAGVPASAPLAARVVAFDHAIEPPERREREQFLSWIAELTLAALGKIQARAALERLVAEQAGQLAQTVQAHAAELARRDVLESEMRQLSITDVLTGLRNRHGFFLHAEQLYKVAQRQHASSAVIFADVDGLKRVNEELGHDAGDHLLRDAAEVFRELFRAADVVARLGGDEFVAYTLADDHPGVILERIRSHLRAFNLMRERPYEVSLSAGIVQCDPAGAQPLSNYIALADQQMSAQKRRRLH